jgi:hypothetical protein
MAGKYENTQFAFPIGPRNNYLDYNGQLNDHDTDLSEI